MTTKVVMVLLTLSLSSLSPFFQDSPGQTQAGEQVGNQPPVANASPDQRVNEGDLAALNGSSSFDPDGEIVSYAWGIEDSDDDAADLTKWTKYFHCHVHRSYDCRKCECKFVFA